MFETCSELWSLFNSFRSGAIELAGFRHRQHLAVALCYAALLPDGEALIAFRDDLLKLIRPLGAEGKYSETITGFWMRVAAHYLADRGHGRCLAQIANEFVEQFADKGLISRHYSSAVLADPKARLQWIEPDVLPVPSHVQPGN